MGTVWAAGSRGSHGFTKLVALKTLLHELARRNGRDPDGARKLASVRLGSSAARRVGATNGVRPTIGELIVQLDGKHVTTAAGDLKLSTAKVIGAIYWQALKLWIKGVPVHAHPGTRPVGSAIVEGDPPR